MTTEYTATFLPRAHELGEDARVGHAALMRWFQETAILASAAAGYGMAKYEEMGAAWVMRGLEVEFGEGPCYGEPIAVTTWLSDLRRVRSHREMSAVRAQDHAIVARARVEWVFLDTRTMRPRRLSPEMIVQFDACGAAALEAIEWPVVDGADHAAHFENERHVQHYEIDQMHHVNNAVYVDWIEQQMRDAERAWQLEPGWRPLRHHVQYCQAAQDGDILQLVSRSIQRDGLRVWAHQILRGAVVVIEARSLSVRRP